MARWSRMRELAAMRQVAPGAATPARPPRVVKQPERHEQKAIIGFLTTLGAKKVYVAGTTRPKGKPCPKCKTFVPEHMGTMQTPGIPDIPFAFLPPPRYTPPNCWMPRPLNLVVIECKRPKDGRFSPEQVEFRELCLAAGALYIGGSLDAVIAWAIDHGYCRAGDVPHYRLPKNLQERA